jgi:hypothetical protein
MAYIKFRIKLFGMTKMMKSKTSHGKNEEKNEFANP